MNHYKVEYKYELLLFNFTFLFFMVLLLIINPLKCREILKCMKYVY